MKYFITLMCCLSLLDFASAQEDTIKTEVKKDTTRIVLGNKEIKIIDTEEGTDIKVRDKVKTNEYKDDSNNKEESHEFNMDKKKKKRDGGFRGHLDGVEFGFNGFLNKKHEMSLSGEDNFMSLNTNPAKSTNLNVNFCQVSQGLIGNSIGMVTGLRIEFNNYFFENNNTILKNKEGVVVPYYYDSVGIRLDKSKLAMLYFTIPILFEFQFPATRSIHKRLWIAGGILGSIKINSHTKVVYHDNSEKKKDKNRDDFNINVLRYGFTGRVGYSKFFAYGNYFPVQFFEKNKGPELYPIMVGIGFHFD